ncbi:hypothetical protein HZB74_04005 [Candidatus Saccharibacteria bacterium]|nr:hypothetical protein [Candidatus Saccharibacteria bacterium]
MGPNNPQDIQQQPGQTFGPGSQPPAYQTPVPPSTPQHHTNTPKGDKKTKKLIIAIAVLLGIFAILAIIVLASGGNKKQAEQPVQNTKTESLVKEPTAIDVENVNNSISDDVTNLSTDNDFPADNLSDEKLEL